MPKIVVVEMVGCAADSFCVEICGCELCVRARKWVRKCRVGCSAGRRSGGKVTGAS